MKFILTVWHYVPVLAHAPILNLIDHFHCFEEVWWSPQINIHKDMNEYL